MPKNREQKQEILRDLKTKIGQAKSIVFAKFDALGVKDNERIRKSLRTEEGEYYVVKKTLLAKVLKENNHADIETKNFDGQVAAIFGYGDEAVPAKIIDKFKNEKDKENKISFLGGILENRFITAAEVNALAKIPARKELYAKMVGTLNAPISGFVNALAGNMRNFVYVLNAIKDKK